MVVLILVMIALYVIPIAIMLYAAYKTDIEEGDTLGDLLSKVSEVPTWVPVINWILVLVAIWELFLRDPFTKWCSKVIK